MFGSAPVVKNIIILNIGVFILQHLTNGSSYDVSNLLSLHDYRAEYFYPWQYLTYMFTHVSKTHFFFNMIPLIILGPSLEKLLGQKKFLLFYLLVGLGAGVATNILHSYQINQVLQSAELIKSNLNAEGIHEFVKITNPTFFANNLDFYELFKRYISQPHNAQLIEEAHGLIDEVINSIINKPLLGSSGAVYGILVAAALYLPNKQLPVIPIKFKWLVLFYLIMEFRNAEKLILSGSFSHFIHLSGMLFALLFYIIWKRKGFNTSQTMY